MTGVAFLKPWKEVSADQSVPLLRELEIEVAPGHPLYGVKLKAIAQSTQADDVLFQFEDGRVADVHLTYRRAAESFPWPHHEVYPSLEEWMQQAMIEDHEDMT